MHRLFVAIRPPPAVRAALAAAMGGVSGARWQDDDLLHLTLRFIGKVDRRLAEDVGHALAAVQTPRFDVALGPIGTFERRGAPQVVWAGIEPNEALKRLRQKIEQACIRAGLEPEGRAFHPHITLARLPRSAGPIAAAFDASPALADLTFTVDAFALFESSLSAAGATYTIVARYPLD